MNFYSPPPDQGLLEKQAKTVGTPCVDMHAVVRLVAEGHTRPCTAPSVQWAKF